MGLLSLFPLAQSQLWAAEGRLQEALKPLLSALPQGSEAAVSVYSLDRQRMVFTHNDQAMLRLASLTKLPVAAAALLDLGPDYQFVTSLVDLGNGMQGGSISGLGIIGRGDPCLDEHHSDGQPDQIFLKWAAQLQAKGLRRIAGDVVIDNSFFSGPIRPTTYPGGDRNVQAWYSAPASAFAWNDNCIEVQVRPTTVGQAVAVHTRPRSPRISINNKATTENSRLSKGLVVSRSSTANTIFVSGRYNKTTSWFPVAIHEDPDLLAGDHLAALFRDAGIIIDGQVRLGKVPTTAPTLLEHRSDLLDAVNILNQRSQNFYGEQIIRVLGNKHQGTGSVNAGTQTVEKILSEQFALPENHVQLLDGSGLSYDNQASSWYICQILARMDRSALAKEYHDSLREASIDGVSYRYKTGTLAVARCLAGYIDVSDDERYAFTIILNKGTASASGWGDRDAVLKAIISAVK